MTDHLGSISQATSSTGAVTLTREYDLWGNPVQGSATPSYAYTGREWDPESSLYYYRARYYDPTVGRFLRGDPFGYLDGPNVYSYVGNNPLTYRDPLGLAATQVGGPTNSYNCLASALGTSSTWVAPCDNHPSNHMTTYGCTPVSCDAKVPCDKRKAIIFEEEENPGNWHAMSSECGRPWTSKNGGLPFVVGIGASGNTGAAITYYNQIYKPQHPFSITCWSCPSNPPPWKGRTRFECWP